MSEPVASDNREALRGAVAMIAMSHRGDVYGMERYLAGVNPFELGAIISSLALWASVGIHATAQVRGLSFDEMLAWIERQHDQSFQDGAE